MLAYQKDPSIENEWKLKELYHSIRKQCCVVCFEYRGTLGHLAVGRESCIGMSDIGQLPSIQRIQRDGGGWRDLF